MEVRIKVDENSFYIEYIRAFNGFLNLSKNEILILAEFLKEESLLHKENKDLLFDTSIRKRIQDRLGISVYNLNNYISGFKSKGIMVEQDGKKYLNPRVIPKLRGKDFNLNFKFIWKSTTP